VYCRRYEHFRGCVPNARLCARKNAGNRGARSDPSLSKKRFAQDDKALTATAALPPYLVLLRVGFALPVASLRRRCALTAPFHPYLAIALNAEYHCHPEQALFAPRRILASRAKRRLLCDAHAARSARFLMARLSTHSDGGAVYFLWHFPSSGLDATLPDVIRHTALWSSDFPPPFLDGTGATVRSSCQQDYYMR